MADFTKPALTSTYTNFITELKERDNDISSLFSNGSTFTGTYPTRAIRWNESNGYFERRNAANNAFERLEGASGTHKFVNLETGALTVNSGATITGDLSATGQVQGARFNVTGTTAPANGFYLPAANEVRFTTNSLDRLTIEASGEIGIGTVDPAYTLDINGTFRLNNGSNDSYLEIGKDGTGNRNAYIDLVGDTHYNNYGLRIQRFNTGQNSVSSLIHRGTGNFEISATEAADIVLKTSNTTSLIVDASANGFVGIGDMTGASHSLHIKKNDANGTYIRMENTEGSAYIGADGDSCQIFGDAIYFFSEDGTGQYLISNSSLFDIKTAAKVNGNLEVTGTINATVTGTTSNANDINIDEKNDNTAYQVTFSDLNGTNYQRQYIDTDDTHLLYNPFANLLYGLSISCSNLTATGTVSLTASDSLLLGGVGVTASGNRWGVFTPVGADGVMEVGRYIDFHIADNSTVDSSGRIDCDGNHFIFNLPLIPSGNRDLGTSSNRWQNLYVNDLKLSNKGGANDVDGTWGDWTLQEAENTVYMLNNRNGKKYRINMTEVDM